VTARRYARVIVDVEPLHLDRPFDYVVPDGVTVAPGHEVRVSFAGRRRNGWVVAVGSTTDADPARIKELVDVRGPVARFDADDLRLLRWVARRWGGTLASVLRHAIPRRVAAAEDAIAGWGPPPDVAAAERPPCPTRAWTEYAGSALLRAAAAPPDGPGTAPAFWLRPLPNDDLAALVVDLVARCLAAGRGALVLAPDPQSPVPDACLALVGRGGADLRGARSDRARYRAFLRGRTGHARVVVGERGAVFGPLRHLGLIVVTDEANPAYKERRSPRHNARDVALARGRMVGATTVLTGALPSAAVHRLLGRGDIAAVDATRARVRERSPRVDVVDPRERQTVRSRLSGPADDAVRAAVAADGAAVVLVARRGDGTVLACRRCGLRAACPVCEGSLAPLRTGARRCATCGWSGPAEPCAACSETSFAPLAAGTTRWGAELRRAHPEADVVVMEGFDAEGPARRPAIAVMTRGSVVRRPAWLGDASADVLVLPDADALLGRPRYDAAEDVLRLCLTAVWARRMIIQTRQPTHPAIQALVRWDPEGFWHGEAARRAELGYPPSRVLINVDLPTGDAEALAGEVAGALPPDDDPSGPDLDGRVVVKSNDPRGTLSALDPMRRRWARDGLRVTVDVDPVPSLDRITEPGPAVHARA
jgi:primosomal protein N' (replication factor Y)